MTKLIKKNKLLGILSIAFIIFLFMAIVPMITAPAKTFAQTENVYFKSASVTLNKNIVLNYQLNVPEGYTSASIVYTYRGEQFNDSKDVTDLTEVTFSFDQIAPQNMTETISATVNFTADGKDLISETSEDFSVAKYCYKLLNCTPSDLGCKTQAEYDSLRTLAVNLLNYGAKAQTYTNNTATPASDFIITTAQKEMVTNLVPDTSDFVLSGTDSELVKWKGASIYFDSHINMVFYAKIATATFTENQNAIALNVQPQGGSVTTISEYEVVSQNDTITEIKVIWKDVSVTNFDKLVTAQITLGGNAVGYQATYSVASYVYAMQTSANATMKALATSVYNYGLSASDYISKAGKDVITEQVVELPKTSFIEYVQKKNDLNLTEELVENNTRVIDWQTVQGLKNLAGMVADDSYMYVLALSNTSLAVTDTANFYRNARILKYDTNMNLVGYSAQFKSNYVANEWQLDKYLYMFLNNGYIYTYTENSTPIRIAVADITADGSGALVTYDNGISFGQNTITNINAVSFNQTNNKYAVLEGNVVSLYSTDNLTTAEKTFSVTGKRMFTDANYLYVSEITDGVYAPTISIYNWNGDFKYSFKVENNETATGLTAEQRTKTNVQGIVEFNNNFYYGIIGFSNGGIVNKGGICILKQTYSSKQVTKSSLKDIKDNDYAFDFIDSVEKNWISGFIYNSQAYGQNLYYLKGGLSSGAGNLTLVKRNVGSNQEVASASFSVTATNSTWESVPMFIKDGNVYIYVNSTDGWKSISCEFTGGATLTSATVQLGTMTSSTGIEGVYYWSEGQKTAVLDGTKITVVNADNTESSFNVASSFASVPKVDGSLATANCLRLSGSADGYIYVLYYAQGTVSPAVKIYSFDGKLIDSILLPYSNFGITNSSFKISGISEINGDLYCTILGWENPTNGGFIGKIAYQNVTENVSMSLNEYFEISNKTGATLSASSDVKQLYVSSDLYAKGICTDGTYGYYFIGSSALNANKKSQGQIFKIDINSGAILGKSALFETGADQTYSQKAYVFHKDGYIYITTGAQTMFRIATADFNTEASVAPESIDKSTLVTTGVKISSMSYCASNQRFVVAMTNWLTIHDASGKELKSVGGTFTNVCGIYNNEQYIYVLYEKNSCLNADVYDYNLTKVGALVVSGLMVGENNSNNIQGLFELNGKIYVAHATWGGTTGAGARVFVLPDFVITPKA